MAITRLTPETLGRFKERLAGLKPDSPRRWGKMQPIQLLPHLRRTFEISLGDVPVETPPATFWRRGLRWLVFGVLPWPKGRIKAPEMFFPAPGVSFEEERAATLGIMERFAAEVAREPDRPAPNPVFGRMDLRFWSLIHGRHLDHHLRQFGL